MNLLHLSCELRNPFVSKDGLIFHFDKKSIIKGNCLTQQIAVLREQSGKYAS